MSQPDNKTIPLYEIVDTANRITADLQQALDDNQSLGTYTRRRANPRTANVRRIAKIWSEGQLGTAERYFDTARDHPEKLANISGKKGGRAKGMPPLELARQQLLSLWDEIRKEPGFHHAKNAMRKQVSEAGDEVRRLEKEGKRLEQMLGLSMDMTRDLKNGLAQGIRNVPAEPALEKGLDVPVQEKLAAIKRTTEIVNQRLGNAGVSPANRPAPGPSVGRSSKGQEDETRT